MLCVKVNIPHHLAITPFKQTLTWLHVTPLPSFTEENDCNEATGSCCQTPMRSGGVAYCHCVSMNAHSSAQNPKGPRTHGCLLNTRLATGGTWRRNEPTSIGKDCQKRRGIGVSVHYSCTDQASVTSFLNIKKKKSI